jgi:catechol 2,3-dioxygenase-like lactoylglutathione lyase family enzyme
MKVLGRNSNEYLREGSVMMKTLHVESFHTVLFCLKWDACVAFYRDVLGLAVVDEKPGFVEFEVTAESRIGLIRATGNKALAGRASQPVLSFRVENAERVHRMLSARGASATAMRKHPWGAYLFELRDPDERRLEFWTQ